MERCKKCGNLTEDAYCGNCGTPTKVERINGRYLINEFAAGLFMEKGIFKTIGELALRPGESIKAYLTNDRTKLMKPVFFIIISSLIYVLSHQLFSFSGQTIVLEKIEDNNITAVFKMIFKNYGYANILMAVFIAFYLRLFFQQFPFNYFENLVLLLYTIGFSMIILSFFDLLSGILKIDLSDIASFSHLVYIIWALGQFFGGKFSGYFRTFWAYIFGLLTFILVVLLIGFLNNFLTTGSFQLSFLH